MRASPAVRSLRAAVFAALCVLLAAGGHTLATGMAPPVWAQTAGFVPVFAAGWLLGGRERSLGAIGGATLAAQGGLHLAFGAARPHTVMVMHGMRMTHSQTHALTPHATAAHLSAALLLTWWLRRGEAALWSLLRRSVTLVPGLAAWWQGYGEPAAPAPARPAPDYGPRPPRPLLLRHTVHRRGPPTTIPYTI
ncbi:hypothetical protein AB0D34_07150 [Streptomyces sp. NPDC048420]|uniref:hypothetical protein n=1 Tax=Streptomyces sp. NPDC048420 TaxID=3155755 RepID=UPI00341AFC2F